MFHVTEYFAFRKGEQFVTIFNFPSASAGALPGAGDHNLSGGGGGPSSAGGRSLSPELPPPPATTPEPTTNQLASHGDQPGKETEQLLDGLPLILFWQKREANLRQKVGRSEQGTFLFYMLAFGQFLKNTGIVL